MDNRNVKYLVEQDKLAGKKKKPYEEVKLMILNDLQDKVIEEIMDDEIQNAEEKNHVLKMYKFAKRLNKQWDIYDEGEYEAGFSIEGLRINPNW